MPERRRDLKSTSLQGKNVNTSSKIRQLLSSVVSLIVTISVMYLAYIQFETVRVHAEVAHVFSQFEQAPPAKISETKRTLRAIRDRLDTIDSSTAFSRYQRSHQQVQTKLDALIREIDNLPDETSSSLEWLSFGFSVLINGQESSQYTLIRHASEEFQEAIQELTKSVWLFQ